ncbi:MAG: hypothetical protein JXR13_19160 [Thalassovita sp.]
MEIILLSLLGFGVLAGLMDGDSPEPEVGNDEEPGSPDRLAPEAPTLGEGAIDVTDTVGQINDGASTVGGAYQVTDNAYDITTGSGEDTLVIEGDVFGVAFLGDGDDAVWGGEGRDVLLGEGGNDSLFGGDENDDLIDTDGENSIYGGAGDDFIRGSNGSTIVGGDGADEYDLHLSTSAENPLRLLDYDPDTDRLNGIRFFVSDGDTSDVNFVARETGDGVDVMFGDSVLAEVFGASVDDFIDIPVTIVVDGGTFTDDDTGHNILSNFYLPETISASGGDDTIRGGPGDLLDAGDGNDLVFASGQLTQDVSNPSVMSTVQGGSGDDIILSSNGNVLTGGDGADIFGLSLTQYGGGGPGSGFDLTESRITDFDPTQDTIYIEHGFILQADGTVEDLEATISIQVWSNGLGADILAGDEIIARVTGGQTLRVEDLVVAENGLRVDILGYH